MISTLPIICMYLKTIYIYLIIIIREESLKINATTGLVIPD